MFSYDISDELKEIIRKLNKWNKLYKERLEKFSWELIFLTGLF